MEISDFKELLVGCFWNFADYSIKNLELNPRKADGVNLIAVWVFWDCIF